MSKINKRWHLNHVMPKNPTLRQRIAWHEEHAKECGCRPVPEELQKQLNKKSK